MPQEVVIALYEAVSLLFRQDAAPPDFPDPPTQTIPPMM